MGHAVAGKRAGIALDDAAQHLRLALRPVVDYFGLRRAGGLVPLGQQLGQLDLGYPLGTPGPATDQRLDVLVYGIDIGPDLLEIPGIRHSLAARPCAARSPA